MNSRLKDRVCVVTGAAREEFGRGMPAGFAPHMQKLVGS
jgi:hypothetical protein